MTMNYFFLLFCLMMLSFCSAEINYEEHNQTMRIELKRQKKPLEQQINSPLKKYGITMDLLYKPHPKPNNRTNDSVAIYRFLDHEFYGKVVVGHPGQIMNVAFDATWTYTWLLSYQCTAVTSIGCYFHNKYNHYKSSEYKPDGRKFNVSEGSFQLSGFFSYENISIAHSNVTNFSFIEMVQVPNNFILNKADGVLGLGLKVDSYDPFFYTLLNQKKIRDPIFSVYINRNHQSSQGGNILLGFVDQKHIKCTEVDGKKVYDEILYRPVEQISYWQFDMDRIVLSSGPKKNDTFCGKGCKAIIDTSSSTIIGPVDDINAIHEKIQATRLILNRYAVPCDDINKLPTLNFVIGGKTFTLKGPSYVTKLTYKYVSICISALQPAETEEEKTRWILGTSFLQEVYTIYDVAQKRIGLVRSA